MDESQIKKEDAMAVYQNIQASGARPTLYGFPGKTKSTVWGHFGFYMGEDGHLDKSHAICRHCYTAVRYSGNTTNLHTHLARHGYGGKKQPHPLADVSGLTSPIAKPRILPSPTDGENIVTSAQKDTFHPLISEVYGNTLRSPLALNTMIAEYLIDRFEAPEAVDNSAFVNMMLAADPSFDHGKCRRFCESFMSQHHDILNHSLSDILKNCEAVALTYDKWTSASRENYATFNVHVVNTLWEVETYTLATNSDCGSVTEDLEKIRNQWDFQESMTVLSIGDVRQSNHSNIQVVHCLAEAINTAALAGLDLESVREVISGVERIQKQLVQSFSDDRSDSSTFIAAQDKQNRHGWLFTYDVLTKLMEQKELITLMKKVDDIDCDVFCKRLDDVCAVLGPLKTAVDLLCSQRPIIASMILPIIKKLQVSLSPKTSDSSVVKDFKETIWRTLYSAYSDANVRKFLLVASFLDPRYKDLLFVEKEERVLARDVLSEVATELYRRGSDTSGEEEIVIQSEKGGSPCSVIVINNERDYEPSAKKLKNDDKEENATTSSKSDDWLADVIGSKKSTMNTAKEEGVLAEIDQYHTMEQRTTSPFVWWNHRQSIFTTLSRVAKTYLCVPATSRSPDQMFVAEADRDGSQRRLLSSDHVDRLVFLHNNYFKLKN